MRNLIKIALFTIFLSISSIGVGQKVYFQAGYARDVEEENFSFDDTYALVDQDNDKFIYKTNIEDAYFEFDIIDYRREDTEDYIVVTVVLSTGAKVIFHESKYFDFCSMRTKGTLYTGKCGEVESDG